MGIPSLKGWSSGWNEALVRHFPHYWPFVRGIHRSPVNSSHKGQWHGALVPSLICAWINGWVNNRESGDLRSHRAHYDVIVMCVIRKGHFYNELASNRSEAITQTDQWFNSLRPSDAICRHRSGSTLAQVMACCLTAPSHYLNQYWLIIIEVQWHSY